MNAVGIDGTDQQHCAGDLETDLRAHPARKRELASRSRRQKGSGYRPRFP